MRRWMVADSLYAPGQFFCSHLDSYSHYLRLAGEDVNWAVPQPDGGMWAHDFHAGRIDLLADEYDFAFLLDRYDLAMRVKASKRIAQVAAICSPMPWDVRKPDGSPAYDLILSSIPALLVRAREAGCNAEYMPLAFDLRARSCVMQVRERDIPCLFIGTVGPNHVRRTRILNELRDVVTVLPPVFGHDYYRTLARAKVVVNIHAEWAQGAANNMRLFEAAGMGCEVVSDGADFPGMRWWFTPENADDADAWRFQIGRALNWPSWNADKAVMTEHTYECRIPRIIDLARSI